MCIQERTQSYNIFELELKTQFAASSDCVGITVSRHSSYPQDPEELPLRSYPDRIGVFR